jgi:hypothetical protein
MATPQYDAFRAKVRDWANRREAATIPDSIIEDCIRYGNDDVYRLLRIPQLEQTVEIVIGESNNTNRKFTQVDVPEDLIEFIYLAQKDKDDPTVHKLVYNQVNDIRTFLDPYAEQYNRWRYVWKDLSILISPKLEIGDTIELHYYRRLPQFNALYAVIPANWDPNFPDNDQPLLTYEALPTDDTTTLYKAGTGANIAVFKTLGEAEAWVVFYGGTATPLHYEGKEAWNWLRDAHEKLAIYAALVHVGLYLRDDKLMSDNQGLSLKIINDLNREDKYRRAKGGNIQTNVNTGGLI